MQRCEDTMKSAGRTLEDLFFHKHDAVLIEKHKELARLERSRKALSEATGITNPRVLKNLVELEIHAERAAALAFVPLVEVAWADGELDPQERHAVLAGAALCGLREGSLAHALIERWLTHAPPRELLEVWSHYIKELCRRLGAAEREALKDAVLKQTRAIAQASGGFLGLTTGVSAAEKHLLGKLDLAFE